MGPVSMWTSFFVEEEPEQAVRLLIRHGYHHAELSDEHGAMLLSRGAPGRTGRDFGRWAAAEGMSFPQGHLLLRADIAHPDPSERNQTLDELKSWLELFEALGIAAAVLHPGGQEARKENWPEEKISDIRRQSLRQLADFTRGSGLKICLENIPKVCPQAEDLLGLIAAAQVDMGICLDTGHLNLSGGGAGRFIRECGDKLRALHIADNLGVNDDHIFPYGRGTVDWPDVMRGLREIGYAGLFNFEVPGERFCPGEVKAAKLDYGLRLARFLRESCG